MKKIVLVFALALAPLWGFSQSIFDKYEAMDNVGSVTVNKGLIRLAGNLAALDKDDEEAQSFAKLARGLNGIRVFFTEDQGISKDMGATVQSYLKTSSMEELMRIKDKEANVKLYVKNGRDENHVTELLMFVSDIEHEGHGTKGRKFESVLISMTGDIDLNKISALTKKMNLPKELDEAGKRQ